MTQNDFLKFFFDLPPFVVALIVWVWGFGSLVLYGLKTKAIKNVVLRTPGIIIGDFFIIPALAFMVVYFYQAIQNPLPETSSFWWTLITCVVGLILAAISAIRFNLANRWFLPHILFYWFMVYIFLTFLTKGLYQLVLGGGTVSLWTVWTLVLVGVLIHLVLGVVWSKRFPRLDECLTAKGETQT